MLQYAHLARRLQVKHLHYLVTVNARLQQTFVVTLRQVGNLLAHQGVVVLKLLFACLVLARYVSLAQQHKVIGIVAGIVYQPSYGAVRHLRVGNDDGAHVHIHHQLHIFHLPVLRQFQSLEYARHHLRPYVVMRVECPSLLVVPSLALRLAYVVQQGSPSQPQVV